MDGIEAEGSGRQEAASGACGNSKLQISENIRHSGDRNGNKQKNKKKAKEGE